jgi:hypothetical protein
MICTRQIFCDSPDDAPFDLADTLEDISRNGQLPGYEVSQRFYEIGLPAGLTELNRLCQERLCSKNRVKVPRAALKPAASSCFTSNYAEKLKVCTSVDSYRMPQSNSNFR